MRLPHLLLCALVLTTVACQDDKKEGKSDKANKADDKADKKKSDDDKSDKKSDDDKADKKKKGDDDKSAKKGDDDKADKKKGDDDKSDKKGDDDDKGDAPKKVAGAHAIAGADVPPWSMPATSKGKCVFDKKQKAMLDALQKGDDDGKGFDDGKGDVAAIVSDLLKSCPSAGAAVSQALNAGGYSRYNKKQYDKADGWFARALVADSSNTFARYNLACNLALEGKKDESLWNLQQLVPAANAKDPRAIHYLRKASNDSDLKSVKSDAKFTAATGTFDKISEKHNCGPDMVWSGKPDKDGSVDCVQICAGIGTHSTCGTGKVCSAGGTFGDGVVPSCTDSVTCKAPEQMMVVDHEAIPTDKFACYEQCENDGSCSGGKKCGDTAWIITPYNTWLLVSVCKKK